MSLVDWSTQLGKPAAALMQAVAAPFSPGKERKGRTGALLRDLEADEDVSRQDIDDFQELCRGVTNFDDPSRFTEHKQRMLAGELYDAADSELVRDREFCRRVLRKFNTELNSDSALGQACAKLLLPRAGAKLGLQAPLYCDYGYNIHIGDDCFFNFNCCILDVCKVTIGHRVKFGPAVQLYTATHPLNAEQRACGLEMAKPITIGDDVWIGGAAVVCPGVSIGARSVVGAGAVVTKDVPADVVVGGNPAKVIRDNPRDPINIVS